jgi:hypothetical protein
MKITSYLNISRFFRVSSVSFDLFDFLFDLIHDDLQPGHHGREEAVAADDPTGHFRDGFASVNVRSANVTRWTCSRWHEVGPELSHGFGPTFPQSRQIV